jgi:hypothetical protein
MKKIWGLFGSEGGLGRGEGLKKFSLYFLDKLIVLFSCLLFPLFLCLWSSKSF